jgi:hypothetical protein
MKNLLTLTLLCLINFSFAQSSYNVTDFETEAGKTRGSIFEGIDEDGFIYTTSYKTTYIVFTTLIKEYLKVFNAQTGLMHAEVPLEKSRELKGRGMEFVSLTFIDEKPTIICKKLKPEKPENYYGIHIDNNGALLGEAFKIGESGDCTGFKNRSKGYFSGVYHSKSENGDITFISDISCSGDDLKTYRVLELDNDLNIGNTFTFKLDYESISDLTYVTSGDQLFLKVETREKEKIDGKVFKRWITTHRLFRVSKTDGGLDEINVQDSFEPNIVGDFRMKSVDKGILLSGQIIQEKGFAGMFSAFIDEYTNEVNDIQTEYFDIDFVTKYWSDKQKEKEENRRNRKGESEEDENFSTNFELMETFDTSDEGLISVFQEFILKVVTSTSTSANGMRTTTTRYYYYYKDVIIVKTGKDGKIEYTKLLPFYQLTVDYNPGKGYSALKIDNDIYFLHGSSNEINDMIEDGEKSNDKSKWRDRKIQFASITHLNTDGTIDTEQVLDLNEANVSIDPNVVGVDEKNKQFVIVSPVMKMFNFKKTKIIRIEL